MTDNTPDIHPLELALAYEERETQGKATPQGYDPAAIIAEVAKEYRVSIAEVTRAVLKHTIGEPN